MDLLAIAADADGCDQLRQYIAAILDRLAATQDPDGNWAAVLGDSQAPAEASTAAFFAASALHPAARAIWTAPAQALERSVAALQRAVDASGLIHGVSADILPSWDIEDYRRFTIEPSPWAQGAALRALAALARVQ